MAINSIGVMSPGDMGSGVGGVLAKNGVDVWTSLQGRSAASKERAAQQGIKDAGSLDDLVEKSDLILSIMVPSEAVSFAEELAASVRRNNTSVYFADCNAVSPDTGLKIGEIVSDADIKYIDAGIIGGTPRNGAMPKFYASGPYAEVLAELDGKGILVPVLDGPIGRASGLKMVYAALTKGVAALYSSTLMTAQSLDLFDDLIAELEDSQPGTLKGMNGVNTISTRAFRWIGEMYEIADTFESAGATPKIHQGAADTFTQIAESSIGHERNETIDRSRHLKDTITAILTDADRKE